MKFLESCAMNFDIFIYTKKFLINATFVPFHFENKSLKNSTISAETYTL